MIYKQEVICGTYNEISKYISDISEARNVIKSLICLNKYFVIVHAGNLKLKLFARKNQETPYVDETIEIFVYVTDWEEIRNIELKKSYDQRI